MISAPMPSNSIFDSLRATVPCVVLDVPHQWTGWTKQTLVGADDVLIVAAPDLANLRNTKNIYDFLKAARPNDRHPRYCLNQVGVPKRPEIKAADFAKALESEAMAIIPFEPQLFGAAANNGQMIAEISANHRTAEMFRALARHLTGRAEPEKQRVGSAVAAARKDVGVAASSVGVAFVFGKRPTGASAVAVEQRPNTPAPAAPPPPPPASGSSEGGRAPIPSAGLGAPIIAAPTSKPNVGGPPSPPQQVPTAVDSRRSETYYEIKGTIFGALIEAIDLAQLAKLDADSAREEIRDIVNEIIAIKNIVMSISEQEDLLDDICNDVLGYGPLEPLLARDDIADIMVNGSGTVYIEVAGKIQKTGIRFRDNQQLLNICQRIVSQVGRRVDEILADLRRALAGRLARQRHRAAAGDRRARAHHPQVQEGQADARAAGTLRLDFAGRR